MSADKDYALKLLPVLVWEDLLDHMEKSSDIQSVLSAFQGLDVSLSQKKKRTWLIGEVLPFICKNLTQKDYLNLRLVSKKWKLFADFFLVNQAFYRAYSENIDSNNKGFWDFMKAHENNFVSCGSAVISFQFLDDPAMMEFLRSLPAGSNPFIFGEVRIDISERLMGPQQENLQYILNRFGGNGYYLAVVIEEIFATHQVLQFVRILQVLNSLKGMYLQFRNTEQDPLIMYPVDLTNLVQDLPALPDLNTIVIETVGDDFVELYSLILAKYANTVSRLCAPAYVLFAAQTRLYPNLNELSLLIQYDPELESSGRGIEKQYGLVDQIANPSTLVYLLFKFQIDCEVVIIINNHFLGWLQHYPLLQYLEATPTTITEGLELIQFVEDPDLDRFIIPSLQMLKITDGSGLNYGFLTSFPNLRSLEVNCVYNSSTVTGDMLLRSSEIRQNILTKRLGGSPIWNENPKLQQVTVKSFVGANESVLETKVFHRNPFM